MTPEIYRRGLSKGNFPPAVLGGDEMRNFTDLIKALTELVKAVTALINSFKK